MTQIPEETHKDDDGREVISGDVICFSYGIPPVRVEAKISTFNGKLFAMTPGHKPEKCELSKLRKLVGNYYKIRGFAV